MPFNVHLCYSAHCSSMCKLTPVFRPFNAVIAMAVTFAIHASHIPVISINLLQSYCAIILFLDMFDWKPFANRMIHSHIYYIDLFGMHYNKCLSVYNLTRACDTRAADDLHK